MLVVILVEHQGYTAIIRDNFSEDEPLKKDDAAAINYEERDNGCRGRLTTNYSSLIS